MKLIDRVMYRLGFIRKSFMYEQLDFIRDVNKRLDEYGEVVEFLEEKASVPEPRSLSKSGAEDATSDSGQAFIAWLTRGITENQLAINTPKARLHVLPEGLGLVSPGIFRDFDPCNWQQVQRRFQKLRIHRKTQISGPTRLPRSVNVPRLK